MKATVLIVRIPLGLVFVMASLMVLLNLAPQPELEGKMKVFTEGVAASTYLMPLIKVTELICGLAFLSGFFVPLATVAIFPITLNILLVHLFVEPSGLPVALALLAGNLFLAYACRRHYRALFSKKIQTS